MDYERFEFEQPNYGTVNVLRFGDTLVDTGHMAAVSRDAVRAALDDGLAGVERVVITHPHSDHVGGSETIPDLAALPHTVYEGADRILRDFTDYLRAARADMLRLSAGLDEVTDERAYDAYFPIDVGYAEDDVRIEHVVTDGETVRLGAYACEVVYTPGHSAHHMALFHRGSGTLLSGDLVSQNGHFMFGPLHCDIGDYKRSLRRVRNLDPDVLVPMHGPPMEDPRARIDDCIEKAERTEAMIRDAVRERGRVTAREIAGEVLGADAVTRSFLTLVVWEYLDHLADRGAISVAVTDDGIVASPS